ncbi:Pyocin activator protein PrtN [Ectopseudomonas mendocina]|uniref:Pyocin activator protein PrtN n=1 Tax=Ectopseudomonas mendocina TaxID=300 RepID=A0ABD7RMM0_ECTME|nr:MULTISPECIES: pyocin activator PrtN family protein [Pseudomonas]MBW8455885.1 pyocin activator PrtN family protein [Pseudomonas sp.]EKS2409376.1 pyocin activator PrtN family protein [Pseudomonas aeruginosa]MCV0280561.1 pyocin activator PrtN family protein [Pseudomonas aeruginosa]TRO08055.1 Pyocin activator protein PrtN [Pseudomonas mendocina]TRO10753.1 Pyocin activator protein PrtN [Pseudomonas mendocina]
MKTLFLLMAQYDGQAVIPIEWVCRDFLGLSVDKFKRKRLMGEIDLPVMRLGANSQKANLGVHLEDLAAYLDRQREAAIREQDQLMDRRRLA